MKLNHSRRRPPARLVLITIAALAAGCGTLHNPPTVASRPAGLGPWPSAADYGTIKIAVAVRDHALFHEKDWRRKAFAATLAARTLLTVRISAGPCATFVTQLFGNLRDLMDAHPGENWRPLIRLVRHQPSIGMACRQPGAHPRVKENL
jgi:hypothetical protein